jgi:hypothetical protein
MVPMEGLFCPCCTSAILHTIAQSGTPWLSRSHLMLGTGSLIAAIAGVKNQVVPQKSRDEMTG